jgi:hypothetical protein
MPYLERNLGMSTNSRPHFSKRKCQYTVYFNQDVDRLCVHAVEALHKSLDMTDVRFRDRRY